MKNTNNKGIAAVSRITSEGYFHVRGQTAVGTGFHNYGFGSVEYFPHRTGQSIIDRKDICIDLFADREVVVAVRIDGNLTRVASRGRWGRAELLPNFWPDTGRKLPTLSMGGGDRRGTKPLALVEIHHDGQSIWLNGEEYADGEDREVKGMRWMLNHTHRDLLDNADIIIESGDNGEAYLYVRQRDHILYMVASRAAGGEFHISPASDGDSLARWVECRWSAHNEKANKIARAKQHVRDIEASLGINAVAAAPYFEAVAHLIELQRV